jgi:DNA mismatch repair protein MSH4
MREAAFILRNIDGQSMAIVDELGRGTSTRDGLAIAIAIAEALIESRALVWFVTHFRDLAKILAERNGVVNLHLAVDNSEEDKMEMLYRVSSGAVQDEHYGLKLARVMPLPPDVIEHAELVSATLDQAMRKKKSERASLGIVVARKRRLLLNLKEHLTQAKNGSMDDEDLTQWLKDLQREFVVRMSALEEEERALRMNPDGDDDDGDGDCDTTSQGQGTSRAISTAVTDTESRSQ